MRRIPNFPRNLESRLTNDVTNPAAMRAGPNRPLDAAVPNTTGRIGKTQGEKMERLPARKAKKRLVNISVN